MDGDRVTKIVCIVGMHRSGTSCLAGSLEEAGICLGAVNTAATHNAKGNRENKRIWELHDAVLRHSGGSWLQPPHQVGWSDEHRAERDSIILTYKDQSAWGFKDPRTLLLLDFWREAIANLTFVGTFRHPRLVAQSLFQREGRHVEHWLGLWAHYNARLVALHDERPFPVLRFDLDEAAYRRSLTVVMRGLGLEPAAQAAFFEPGLRHHEAQPTSVLPEGINRLYQTLCAIALDPSSA
jgi:hypothetical protein